MGSEFQRHCARETDELALLADRFAPIERYRVQHGAFKNESPLPSIRALREGGMSVSAYFSHFLICNFEALPVLLTELKRNVAQRAQQMLSERKQRSRRHKRTSAA